VSAVDINSDLGEGYGNYVIGNDEALLGIITSANVACGGHAGDPEIMARTFGIAAERGVAVGAHPGFPDLWGFGRRNMPYSLGEIERLVAYQTGAAMALAVYAGHRITYVKPHGALANMAAADMDIAEAIAKAVKAVDPDLALLGIALSCHIAASEKHGLKVYHEIFADRGYDDQGQLIARGQPGALIEDAETAAKRVVEMIRESNIVCASGKRIKTPVHSICIHGDSAHAVITAEHVRAAIEGAGIALAPFAPATTGDSAK
jgi:UPF0271 protein